MVDHRHYLPILKGKAGEYDALKHLSAGVGSQLTPIIEVPPIEWKYNGELGVPTEPKASIDEHIRSVPENLQESWGSISPVFVDLLHLENNGPLANGEHPLAHLFDEFGKLGLKAIPVTGLNRSREYQNAVIDTVHRDGRGVCIRVDRQQCGFPTSLAAGLQALAVTLDVASQQVDLILDFGSMNSTETSELCAIASAVVSELPCVSDLRTISVAATGMPRSVTRDMERFSVSRLERTERILWRAIASERDLPRIPNFSDYGVTHPDYLDLDWRELSLGGKIRYTAEEIWIIVKGRKLENAGDQFHELSRMLLQEPEFCGAEFSWGDESIAKCAALDSGPGNLTNWLAFTTNHHLRFVTRQLANGP